eukprot:scaffold5248_cov49-Phaeocystis_antarctica.AAC.1
MGRARGGTSTVAMAASGATMSDGRPAPSDGMAGATPSAVTAVGAARPHRASPSWASVVRAGARVRARWGRRRRRCTYQGRHRMLGLCGWTGDATRHVGKPRGPGCRSGGRVGGGAEAGVLLRYLLHLSPGAGQSLFTNISGAHARSGCGCLQRF